MQAVKRRKNTLFLGILNHLGSAKAAAAVSNREVKRVQRSQQRLVRSGSTTEKTLRRNQKTKWKEVVVCGTVSEGGDK